MTGAPPSAGRTPEPDRAGSVRTGRPVTALVLGAGFLGLNLARELLRGGLHAIVIEAQDRPGGVSMSRTLDDCPVDRFYHTILPTDSALLGLIEELGLGDVLSWRRTRSGFFQDGRVHSVSTPFELLTFPVLTLPERIRLGWAVFRAQRLRDWSAIEEETCEEWLSRTCGRSVYEKLWAPLLRAKLGEAAPRVSASFIWATIHRLQAGTKDGSRLAKDLAPGMMGYLHGGYQQLIDALAEDVVRLGGEILTNLPAKQLTSLPDGRWRLGTAGSDPGANEMRRPDISAVDAGLVADHVVSTVPPSVLNRIVESPVDGLGRGIEGLGVVCELLLLDRPLTEFYILNLGDPELPFTGIIESTHLAPAGEFGTGSLVYLPRYLAPGDPWADLSDEEVSRRFRISLRRVFPTFEDDWVRASAIERAPFVQPIHTCDYRSRMPRTRPAPGLWVASSTQVHPWPVHNDQILRRAQVVAAEILDSLAGERPRSDGAASV